MKYLFEFELHLLYFPLISIRYTCCNICNFIGIMFSILLIFAYLMADVAPWGHGGDGAGDPPIPPGGFRGTHETDGKSFTKLFCSPYILYIINVVTNYFCFNCSGSPEEG